MAGGQIAAKLRLCVETHSANVTRSVTPLLGVMTPTILHRVPGVSACRQSARGGGRLGRLKLAVCHRGGVEAGRRDWDAHLVLLSQSHSAARFAHLVLLGHSHSAARFFGSVLSRCVLEFAGAVSSGMR